MLFAQTQPLRPLLTAANRKATGVLALDQDMIIGRTPGVRHRTGFTSTATNDVLRAKAGRLHRRIRWHASVNVDLSASETIGFDG